MKTAHPWDRGKTSPRDRRSTCVRGLRTFPLCTLCQEARPGPQGDRREGRGMEAGARSQALALLQATSMGSGPGGWSPPGPSPGPGWVEATWSTGPTVRLRRAIETRTRPPTYVTNAKGAVGVTAGTQTPRPGARGRAEGRGACAVFCAAQRAAHQKERSCPSVVTAGW